MPDLAPGLQDMQDLSDGGYSSDQIAAWKTQSMQDLKDAGYTPDKIDEYFGHPKPDPALARHIEQNLRTGGWKLENMDKADPKSWSEMWNTGWQNSPAGLETGSIPSHQMNEDKSTPWIPWLVQGAGYELGTLPLQVAGSLGGAAAGVEGGPVGIAAGGGFGAGALPEAVRRYYIDGLENGSYKSFPDFIQRNASIFWGASKEGAAFAAGEAAAGPLAPLAKAPISRLAGDTAGKLAQEASYVAAWATASGTTAAALDGRVPTLDDYTHSAYWLAALKIAKVGSAYIKDGAPKLAAAGEATVKTLQDIYKDTGITPQETVASANSVPGYRVALAAKTADGETPTDVWKQAAPELPKPPKPEAGSNLPVAAGEKFQYEEVKPKPLQAVDQGRASPENGIREVQSATPEQLLPFVKDKPMYDDQTGLRGRLNDADEMEKAQTEKLQDLVKRFTNKDGSVDLEAVLAGYHDGAERASVFRASAHDYSKLSVPTRRFLEEVGGKLNAEGGYEFPNRVAPENAPKPKAGEEVPKTKEQLIDEMNAVHDRGDNPTWREKWNGYYNAARYKWSKLYPAQIIDKASKVTTGYGVGVDGMMRLMLASSGKANLRFNAGGLKLMTDETGRLQYGLDPSVPGMKSIYDEAAKRPGSLSEYNAMQTALNAVDEAKLQAAENEARVAAGKEPTASKSRVNLDDALKTIEALGDKWDDLLAKEHLVYKSMMDRLVDSGVMSREGADKWLSDHPNWHPTDGKTDPVEAKISFLLQQEHNAAMNEAKKAAVEGLRQAGLVSAEKVAEGTSEEGNLNADVSPKATGDGKSVEYFDNGKKVTVTIGDHFLRHQIVDMLMNNSYDSPTWAGRTARFMAGLDRALTIENPATLIRLGYKDGMQAFLAHPQGGPPVYNTIRGALKIAGGLVDKDKQVLTQFGEYLANGGYSMAMGQLDRVEAMRDIRKGTTSFGATIPNFFRHPFSAVRDTIRLTDSAARVGGPFTNLKGKIGTTAAAIEARKIHGDYAEPMTDKALMGFARMMPFTSAWMRAGVDATMRAFANHPYWVLSAGGMYAGMTMGAYWNAKQFEAAHPDMPDRYKIANYPDWLKYGFNHVHMQVFGDYYTIHVPHPWFIGELFGAPATGFMEHMYGTSGGKDIAEGVGSALWHEIAPPGGLQSVPIVRPFYEMLSGKDAETGNPIVPDHMKDQVGYMQYRPYTTETAKSLSYVLGEHGLNALNVSALNIDKLITDLAGPLGTRVLKTVEAPVQAAQRTDNDADWFKAAIDGVGNQWFYQSTLQSGISAKPINDFYDLYATSREISKSKKLAAKQGDFDEVQFWGQHPDLSKSFTSTAKALATYRSMIEGIQQNPHMHVEEKQRAITEWGNIMIQAAQNAVDRAHASGM